MTTVEQDALVGRVIRESKEAEANLTQLLTRAEQYAKDIDKLAEEINQRVRRAKMAGTAMKMSGPRGATEWLGSSGEYIHPDAGIEHIRNYQKAVDIDAIDTLDRQIGEAVAAVLNLRRQRLELGV